MLSDQFPQQLSQQREAGWDGIERRSGRDRRNRTMWRKAVLTVSGQRKHARRAEDRANYYVDHYNIRWMAVTITIMVLCCLDALFTLNLIQQGIAIEANPFMRGLIEHDLRLFFLTKYVLTVVGVLVLLTHKNFYVFRRVKVGHILLGFLVMYALLIKYELMLFGLAASY